MNVVEQKKLQAKWNSDIARRNEVSRRINYYENNQRDYLLYALKKAYPKSAKDMVNKFEFCYPLTSRILDDVSILFEEPLKTSIDKEPLEELYSEIIEKSLLNAIMQKVNTYVNLTDKVGVIPMWKDDQVELVILTADNCFVVQDPEDPTKIKELYYQIGIITDTPTKAETVVSYIKWTPEIQSIVDVDNASGSLDNERDIEDNKFGEIPVVWFENDITINTFWHTKTNHIVETNEIVNLELTNFRYILAFQAFSTLVEVGSEDEVSEKTLAPSFSLKLPFDPATNRQPDAKYITPNPKMDTIWGVISDIIVGAAQSVGISAEAYRKENSTINSGYQLRLSKTDILKKTMSDRPYYRYKLKKLIELMLLLYTQNNQSKTFDGVNIKVDFGELKYDQSPEEKERVRAMRLANGTANEIDFIVEDNPDLSRDEAVEHYKQLQDEKKRYQIGAGLEDAIASRSTK